VSPLLLEFVFPRIENEMKNCCWGIIAGQKIPMLEKDKREKTHRCHAMLENKRRAMCSSSINLLTKLNDTYDTGNIV
jgi:hypothetical protein